ncbi:Polypeptide N-acetylgalactosaminyltransferase 3 [Symbiodinium microadriaticum]|uniref:Polypeptide N-acetylgalactosaminyltransferase 3 n=1 Tax=Symbiodinium microadriaticum TaxID=2951 RepID=A0A1Q9CKY3_SYMMI|nr:Polypeptide N-acetylgalactosaminyltransferase 3 [Symbiodinium microadriaticum]
MAIGVEVRLLSGKRASVEVEAEASVDSLRRHAHSALLVPGRGRLVSSSGEVLDGTQTIKRAKLMSGAVLTLHVAQTQLIACKNNPVSSSFAAILGDGSVVCWGRVDNSPVQHLLKNVQQIQVAGHAFAAILGDGSVVTWGSTLRAIRAIVLQQQLRDVQQIQASYAAFAAILGDGTAVTWGEADNGGDSSAIQDQLRAVQQIQASQAAFAAVLRNGSVVTWGRADHGGDSNAVRDQLRDVQQIQASVGAFAAILADGTVVAWGDAAQGGDSSAVQDQLHDVQQIQASRAAFAAVLRNGSVVTWGNAGVGGDSSAVQDRLRDVYRTFPTKGIVRRETHDGIVGARNRGVKEARYPIIVILDSHVEVTPGWLEPLVARIHEDRKRVIVFIGAAADPELDLLEKDVDKKDYFFELGGYDPEIRYYGAEHVEMSFRIWMCGGSMEVAPCSNVGHIYRPLAVEL